MKNSAHKKFTTFASFLFLLLCSCTNTPQPTHSQEPIKVIISTSPPALSTTSPPTDIHQNRNLFEIIYPQLPGKGIVLSLNNLDSSQKEYREIAFLVEVIKEYNKSHPEITGTKPTERDKSNFQNAIIETIQKSEFSYLIDRKYQKSKTELLTFDYYLQEFIGKYYNFYNESTKKNELVQCLGWQPFIGDMVFAYYNFPVAALGHYPLNFPNGVIEIKNHGDIKITKPKNFDDIQKGDTYFYRLHTGIILNKYLYNDKLYFLITESNSPKGAKDYYQPAGEPYLYLADQTKFIQAVGFGDIWVARPNNRYQITIPPEEPTGSILKIIVELEKSN